MIPDESTFIERMLGRAEKAISKFDGRVFANVSYKYYFLIITTFYLCVGALVGWTIAGFLYH